MVIAPGANSGISEQLGYIQQNLFHGSPHVHEIKIKFTLSLSLSLSLMASQMKNVHKYGNQKSY